MNINVYKARVRVGCFLILYYAVFASLAPVLIPMPYPRVFTEWLGFALVLTLTKKSRVIIHPLDLTYMPFVLVVLFGLVGATRETYFSLLTMFPFLFMFFMVRGNGQWLRTVYKILLAADMVYAFFTYFFFFAPPMAYYTVVMALFPTSAASLFYWYSNGWMPGLTSHYSTNGVLLATGSMLAFCEMLPCWRQEGKAKWKWAVCFLYLFAALLLTGKRGPLLFSVAGMFVVYYFYMSNNQAKRILYVVGAILAVVCVAAILINWVPALSQAFYRFLETSEEGDITLGRRKYWEIAKENFIANPYFGIGWGNFSDLAEKIAGKNVDAHNVFLQLLCETGVVGFACFFLMYVNCLWMALTQYFTLIKKREQDRDKEVMLSFALAFMVFFILYCFTGNPLYSNISYMPFYYTCAVAAFYKYYRGKDTTQI